MKSLILIIALATLGLVACQPQSSGSSADAGATAVTPTATATPDATPTPTPPPTPTPAAGKPGANMSSEEVVFDPRTPPPGYFNCHRNHCHIQGGGVASYTQVMEAIGATKIIGAPKPKKMPPAPADVAAPPADATKLPSGIATKLLSKGTGTAKPTAESVVVVHYTGWTTDGKAIDSSLTRGRPATIPLSRVIPGWREGIQLMTEGEERRLWIPEAMAYKGAPGKPKGMLVFDVMLQKIKQ